MFWPFGRHRTLQLEVDNLRRSNESLRHDVLRMNATLSLLNERNRLLMELVRALRDVNRSLDESGQLGIDNPAN